MLGAGMEEFIEYAMAMNDPRLLFILCGIFIFIDVPTSYLRAFKIKKLIHLLVQL